MNIADLLKGLKADNWYKFLMFCGAILFVIALTQDIKVLTNSQLQLLSGGMFLLGFGVWKMEHTEYGYMPPSAWNGWVEGKFTRTTARLEPLGCTIMLVSIVLVILFVSSLTGQSTSSSITVPTAQPTTIVVTPTP